MSAAARRCRRWEARSISVAGPAIGQPRVSPSTRMVDAEAGAHPKCRGRDVRPARAGASRRPTFSPVDRTYLTPSMGARVDYGGDMCSRDRSSRFPSSRVVTRAGPRERRHLRGPFSATAPTELRRARSPVTRSGRVRTNGTTITRQASGRRCDRGPRFKLATHDFMSTRLRITVVLHGISAGHHLLRRLAAEPPLFTHSERIPGRSVPIADGPRLELVVVKTSFWLPVGDTDVGRYGVRFSVE